MTKKIKDDFLSFPFVLFGKKAGHKRAFTHLFHFVSPLSVLFCGRYFLTQLMKNET